MGPLGLGRVIVVRARLLLRVRHRLLWGIQVHPALLIRTSWEVVGSKAVPKAEEAAFERFVRPRSSVAAGPTSIANPTSAAKYLGLEVFIGAYTEGQAICYFGPLNCRTHLSVRAY